MTHENTYRDDIIKQKAYFVSIFITCIFKYNWYFFIKYVSLIIEFFTMEEKMFFIFNLNIKFNYVVCLSDTGFSCHVTVMGSLIVFVNKRADWNVPVSYIKCMSLCSALFLLSVKWHHLFSCEVKTRPIYEKETNI
jgi:hypothetical protein